MEEVYFVNIIQKTVLFIECFLEIHASFHLKKICLKFGITSKSSRRWRRRRGICVYERERQTEIETETQRQRHTERAHKDTLTKILK